MYILLLRYLNPVKETSQPEAFEIAHILISLFILLAGIIVSIFTFVVEKKIFVLQMSFLESFPRLSLDSESPVEDLIYVKHYDAEQNLMVHYR